MSTGTDGLLHQRFVAEHQIASQPSSRLGTISTDPIGFDAGDANLYRYVGNHGTYASDPSGLDEHSDQVRTKLSLVHIVLHNALPYGAKDVGADVGTGVASLYLHVTGNGYRGDEFEGANKAFALSYAGNSSLPSMIAPSSYRATVVPSFQSYASELAVETNELGATYGDFSTPLIDEVALEAAMALLPLKGAGSLNKTALRLEKNLLRKLDSLEHVADAVPSTRQVDNTFSRLSDWAKSNGRSGGQPIGQSIDNDFSKLFEWVTKRSEAQTSNVSRYSRDVFEGRNIYRAVDDFDLGVPTNVDPKYVDRRIRQKIDNGWTNANLMRNGNAPIGRDGRPINLHHVLGDEPGPMVEILGSTHSRYKKPLHGLIEDGSSFRNVPGLESKYDAFRRRFWKWRIEQLSGN